LKKKKNFKANNLIRAEVKKRGISMEEFCELLNKHGEDITISALQQRLSRNAFSAEFMLKCFKLLGATKIDLE
jgi:transcriptional regulator with XRE-family HTH domain